MFENIINFFKNWNKKNENQISSSKDAAKERLHLVLMQDRANVSADFLELMKQEIIDVIKKYIDVDESAIEVKLTNKENDDGTNGAPALYANIPIVNIKNEARKVSKDEVQENTKNNIENKVEVEKTKKNEHKEEKTQANENKNEKKQYEENQNKNNKNTNKTIKSNDTKQSEEQIEKKVEQAKEIIEDVNEKKKVKTKEKSKSKNK